MKTHIILNVTLVCLLLMAGCSKQTTSPTQSNDNALTTELAKERAQYKAKQAEDRSNINRLINLNASQPQPKTEVEQLADKLLTQHLTPCGESWIGIRHYQFTDGTTNYVIVEARSVSLSFDPQQLSDADRLNGIVWNGWIGVHATAIRFYLSADCNLNVNGGKKGWSEWQSHNSIINQELEKKDGKWQIANPIYFVDLDPGIPLEPISCDQKPQ